jgi:hypothetical protein
MNPLDLFNCLFDNTIRTQSTCEAIFRAANLNFQRTTQRSCHERGSLVNESLQEECSSNRPIDHLFMHIGKYSKVALATVTAIKSRLSFPRRQFTIIAIGLFMTSHIISYPLRYAYYPNKIQTLTA